MTNAEKLAWLNDMNAHLAAGGEVAYKRGCDWETSSGLSPSWNSDHTIWRKVPLPRKATVDLVYRWYGDGRFECCMRSRGVKYSDDYQFAEIEVTEDLK